jgi:hypothetical protein
MLFDLSGAFIAAVTLCEHDETIIPNVAIMAATAIIRIFFIILPFSFLQFSGCKYTNFLRNTKTRPPNFFESPALF